MHRGRIYVYIFLTLLVVGTVGGLSYWRYQKHEAQVTRTQQKVKSVKKVRSKDKQQASQDTTNGFTTKHLSQSQRVTNYLKRNHFVGSALLVKGGRIIYRKGFGYADYAKRQVNRPNSEYQILSIQKSLTAVCVMKLITEGRLSLNTKLAKFYPAIRNAKRITIRNLLDMNSGLSLSSGGASEPLREKSVVNFAAKNLASRSSELGQWSYQPVNYVLLAGIISKLTHETYRHNFYQAFVYPFDLQRTGFVQKWPTSLDKTVGYRYQVVAQTKQNYKKLFKEKRSEMQNELGTGQVYMSPLDLFKAEREILRGKVISKRAVAVLHAPGSSSTYGGGVYNQANGIRSHGVGYGYEASILMTRNGNTGVVLMTNNYRPAAPVQNPAVRLFTDLVSDKLA